MGTARARLGVTRRRAAGAQALDLAPAVETAGLVRGLVLADGTRPSGQQRVRGPGRLRRTDAGVRAGVLAPGALLHARLLARPTRVQVLDLLARRRCTGLAATTSQRLRPSARSRTQP